MPRSARLDAPGTLHHVIVRGIERGDIVSDDDDRENFVTRMGDCAQATGTRIYAWALMDNHAHVLLRSGPEGLPSFMRRFLTGYAVSFNRRHRRYGHLFQNRYKSIVCEEDAYFKELVRYIHLNPLRGGMAASMEALERHPWCGHPAIMGIVRCGWQDTDYVLKWFGKTKRDARKAYRDFVQQGIALGRRPELVGGGLIRSMGGWAAAKMLRNTARMKSDERILGDGDFVEEILKAAKERYDPRYLLKAKGYDLAKAAERVGQVTGINPDRIWAKGKHPETVQSRSLLCYWACRELGMKTIELADVLKISQPSVSQSVQRGEKLCKNNGWELIDNKLIKQ